MAPKANLSFYDQTAKSAGFIASKVSKEVFAIDTMRGELEQHGSYKIGAGGTRAELDKLGFPKEGTPLGPNSVITDNHVGLHDRTLGNWREGFNRYGGLTKYGAIILAGTVENFQLWAKSQPCLDEVKGVVQGRLFAYIDGYILSVSLQTNQAAATVSNGQGKIVWGDGDFYVGMIKSSKMHGQGTMTTRAAASTSGLSSRPTSTARALTPTRTAPSRRECGRTASIANQSQGMQKCTHPTASRGETR